MRCQCIVSREKAVSLVHHNADLMLLSRLSMQTAILLRGTLCPWPLADSSIRLHTLNPVDRTGIICHAGKGDNSLLIICVPKCCSGGGLVIQQANSRMEFELPSSSAQA